MLFLFIIVLRKKSGARSLFFFIRVLLKEEWIKVSFLFHYIIIKRRVDQGFFLFFIEVFFVFDNFIKVFLIIPSKYWPSNILNWN